MKSKGKVKKGMWLDAEVVKKTAERAKKENRSFGNMVETILSEYVDYKK